MRGLSSRTWGGLAAGSLLLAGAGAASARVGPLAGLEARVRGDGLLAAGRPARAAEVYREGLERRPDWSLRYGLGTALVLDGSPAAAVPALLEALPDAPPEGRAAVWENLAVAWLEQVRETPTDPAAASRAAAAVEAGRSALRLEPGRPDPAWNVELATRWLDRLRRGTAGGPEEAVAEGMAVPVDGAGARSPHERAVEPAGREGGPALPPGGAGPSGAGVPRGMSAEEARSILDALRADEGGEVARVLARRLAGPGLGAAGEGGPPW